MSAADERCSTVRCVFRIVDGVRSADGGAYEKRISLRSAGSRNEAIDLAEAEAAEYALDATFEFVGLPQSLQHFDVPTSDSEGFSLIRESNLEPNDYLDRFFDTGAERQGEN